MKRHTFFAAVFINLFVLLVSLPSFSSVGFPAKGEFITDQTLCPTDKISFIKLDSKGNLAYFTMNGIRRMVALAKNPNKDSYLLMLIQGIKRGYSVGVIYPGRFDCSVRQQSELEPISLRVVIDK